MGDARYPVPDEPKVTVQFNYCIQPFGDLNTTEVVFFAEPPPPAGVGPHVVEATTLVDEVVSPP